MPNPSDTIASQVPSHIAEEYPKFIQFLKGYYEWMEETSNPYERVKHHMDYLSFDNSLDDYIDMMKEEYLSKIPQDVIGDKKKFIEWSRKLNLARGSHESYKFLFKMMFNEDTTEIYLPKENILKTSDGVWISGQSNMIITNSGNPDSFLYKKIYQQRETYVGHYEYAEAIVDSYMLRYVNGFNVIELTLTDIIGEFRSTHTVFNDSGQEEWPIYTVSGFDIIDGGQNYFEDNELQIAGFDPNYQITLTGQDGQIDTRLSTNLRKSQLTVTVDGSTLSDVDYTYDGRFITSELITLGSTVVFTIPNAYEGSYLISSVNDQGVIQNIKINSLPIAVSQDYNLESSTVFGSGLNIVAKRGLVTPIPGYYVGQKGQLSTQMYLQDGEYYQDYSYVIKTEQDIKKYADVVRDVLHPAGFKFFGNIQLFNILEAIIRPVEDDAGIFIRQTVFETFAKYTLGGNYAFIDKTNTFLNPYRVYKGDEWDAAYVTGDVGYNLEDKSKERTFTKNMQPLEVNSIGWMTKQNLEDFDIRQDNDYFEDRTYDGLYMEPSYILTTAGIDELAFTTKYINIYMTYDYSDEGYAE